MYLIKGDEQYFIDEKINEILTKVKIEFNEEIELIKFYDFFSLEEFSDALNNSGLFTTKKIIIVKNPYLFNNKAKFVKSLITEFIELIKAGSRDKNIILIFSQEIYKYDNNFIPSAAFVFVNKSSEIIEVKKILERDLFSYVSKMFKEKNASISNLALSQFLVSMPNNLSLIESEIDKLLLISKNVTEKMIEDNNFSMSNNIDFALTEAILKWQSEKNIVSKILEQLEYGADSNQIISQISSILINSKNIAILKNNNLTNEEISKIINIHPYRVKLHSEFLNKIGIKKLNNLIKKISKLDTLLKRGKIKEEIFIDLISMELIK
ncbi:DNA polymerase III subunit delta [Metamycoplasma phocicerebrale]|uniref:DNA polymerase III subunit delta n=1 Tax=Metamycoplasma phocicerebrale TaxID=142649 RepID=A0A3T0TU25_9BACT|nr:DNA polymerase III subunit delta [Metamycoplasma phocicerebrale]AZZ65523.1 DNA polymerase III subunit delta [Metamycoplasma phocicerebrale]